ncbi:hypothetical protein R1flu_013484 [Riccia fluitans]|uniref:Large ribosomal subunit protein uL4 C-terminal domain-containing protein n=1 Tax=Riccia fluitans TaxID=41844 RepID=A0ABD1YDI8_9MARC
MAAAARPLVSIQALDGESGGASTTLPTVLLAPIRQDIVEFVHSNVAKNKLYAVCSALAASAIPALLLARGHKIEKVPEVPLVLSDAVENIEKTSAAFIVLKKFGAIDDIEKKKEIKRRVLKKNPLENLGAMLELNPYAKTARRMELVAQEGRVKAKAEKLKLKRSTPQVLQFRRPISVTEA